MFILRFATVIFTLFSTAVLADVRCGDFTLTSSNDGFMHINGVRPESQKFTFLKGNGDYGNIKYEWMVKTNQPGKWLGMEYIKRNGNKRILNVQLAQADMSAPRQYATYDCLKTN
ncbi:hypothetical protein N8S91_10100 [Enterobacter roggenkampii]|uniref:hypothetical protein n=1 Tax=Enterobacteriaceae TaxID=543 RepID=UPI001F2EBEC0|nr:MULTISPECIES: hypothetical protein [Enterobacteriaceae]MCU3050331.1 hypothetical protein [Enterobacter roggenkampii]MCU3446792.1 hypothetical protein [Enterobacter hormaechei subsp. steigerwaltii]MDT7371803.1 hypothetical protein [Citrobacter freundii]